MNEELYFRVMANFVLTDHNNYWIYLFRTDKPSRERKTCVWGTCRLDTGIAVGCCYGYHIYPELSYSFLTWKCGINSMFALYLDEPCDYFYELWFCCCSLLTCVGPLLLPPFLFFYSHLNLSMYYTFWYKCSTTGLNGGAQDSLVLLNPKVRAIRQRQHMMCRLVTISTISCTGPIGQGHYLKKTPCGP